MPSEKQFFSQDRVIPEKKQEGLALHERIKSLIRGLTNRADLEVTSRLSARELFSLIASGQDPNNSWFLSREQDPETKKVTKEFIYIPPVIFESNENVALGKASHEAGHVMITRLSEIVPKDVMQELGFQSTLMSVEERPTDMVVKKRYEGAGKWVEQARKDGVRQSDEQLKKLARRPEIPKFMQLNNLIVYDPYYDQTPNDYDEDVLAVFTDIKDDLAELEQILPDSSDKEEKVIAAAKERYKILYKKIWPKVQELIKKDQEQEELRQMLNQAVNPEQKDLQRQLGKLPPELQQELEELKQKIKERAKNQLQQKANELKQKIKQKKQALDKQNNQPAQELQQETQGLMEQLEQIMKNLHDLANDQINQLPEEMQQDLQQKKEQAIENLKKEIQNQIDQTEKEIEDLFNDPQKNDKEKSRDMGQLERQLKQLKEDQAALEKNDTDNLSPQNKEKLEAELRRHKDQLQQELQQQKQQIKQQLENLQKTPSQLEQEVEDLEKEAAKNTENQKTLEQPELPQEMPADLKQELSQAAQQQMMAEISEQLRQEMEKIFKQLPKEIQQEIIDQAKKALENIEDEAVKNLAGQLIDLPITHEETHKKEEEQEAKAKEKKEAEQRKKQREEDLAKQKSEIDKARERLAELDKNKSIYDQYYDQVRAYELKLYRVLEEIFQPNVRSGMVLKQTGVKINLAAVYRMQSAKEGGATNVRTQIFEAVKNPEKKDYAFCLLNDTSGSMAGEQSEEDFKAKILISEVLNRLGIKFEIWSFSGESRNSYSKLVRGGIIQHKKADKNLDQKTRNNMSSMIHADGGTPTAQAMSRAYASFKQIKAKQKFMVVLTDGGPDNYITTINMIKKLIIEDDTKPIGLGMGKGTDMIKALFPAALVNVEFSKLAETLGELLKDMILFPHKYDQRGIDLDKFYKDNFGF